MPLLGEQERPGRSLAEGLSAVVSGEEEEQGGVGGGQPNSSLFRARELEGPGRGEDAPSRDVPFLLFCFPFQRNSL